MATINVKVKPGADGYGVEMKTYPVVKVPAEPENGRANRALLEFLEDLLGERPGIVSGHRSSRKKIKVDLPEDEIKERLGGYDG
ncbi:MAG: DUF167 domain-containing protein [Candidatus Nanohaloarchaea archaeon]